MVTLLISDVPRPVVIASGPTVPDLYKLRAGPGNLRALPHRPAPAVSGGLRSGAFETPKPGDAVFTNHAMHLVATPQQSLEAAAAQARSQRVGPTSCLTPSKAKAAKWPQVHAALVRQVTWHGSAVCAALRHPLGGETTVTLLPARRSRPRLGRPCQVPAVAISLVCAVARAAGRPRGVHGSAADTDGIDGVE